MVKESLFIGAYEVVRYDIEFNGRTTTLVEYFIGALLGVPLIFFAVSEWTHFSAALPLVIFFGGFVINCLVLFLIALGISEKKRLLRKHKRMVFHLWRAYIILPFYVLCPGVLPIVAFCEYLFFVRK